MSLFETLRDIDNNLAGWLAQAFPRNDDEREFKQQILDLRSRLNKQINAIIARDLDASVERLPADIAKINAAAAQMRAVGKSIDTAQVVLTAVGVAVEITAKILTVVA
jgi:hypothetical protein